MFTRLYLRILAGMIGGLATASSLAATPEPSPSPSPTPSSLPSPNPSENTDLSGAGIFAYSRTLPPTHLLHDRGITYSDDVAGDLLLLWGERKGRVLGGIGIGYSWIGNLSRNGVGLPHSPNHWMFLLQGDWSPPVLSMLYFGGSLRLIPKWAVANPSEEAAGADRLRYFFMGGIGFEPYVGIMLPIEGLFVQFGYRAEYLGYDERRAEADGGGSAGTFDAGYRSVTLTFGFRPAMAF